MNDQNTRVVVKILDKEYQVACPTEERDALLRAARELDSRMRKIRNGGAMIGVDRIAVMVALNLCHELQQCQQQHQHLPPLTESEALQQLDLKLDAALDL